MVQLRSQLQRLVRVLNLFIVTGGGQGGWCCGRPRVVRGQPPQLRREPAQVQRRQSRHLLHV